MFERFFRKKPKYDYQPEFDYQSNGGAKLEPAILVCMETGGMWRTIVGTGLPRVYVPTILGTAIFDRSPLPSSDGEPVFVRIPPDVASV